MALRFPFGLIRPPALLPPGRLPQFDPFGGGGGGGLSFPVTAAGGTASGTIDEVVVGFDIPTATDVWVDVVMNASAWGNIHPFIVLKTGGAGGTPVAAMAYYVNGMYPFYWTGSSWNLFSGSLGQLAESLNTDQHWDMRFQRGNPGYCQVGLEGSYTRLNNQDTTNYPSDTVDYVELRNPGSGTVTFGTVTAGLTQPFL